MGYTMCPTAKWYILVTTTQAQGCIYQANCDITYTYNCKLTRLNKYLILFNS